MVPLRIDVPPCRGQNFCKSLIKTSDERYDFYTIIGHCWLLPRSGLLAGCGAPPVDFANARLLGLKAGGGVVSATDGHGRKKLYADIFFP